MLRPVGFQRLRERLDVAGVVVPVAHEPQLGHVAPSHELGGHGVEHGSRGAGAILGVERYHEQASQTFFFHAGEHFGHARFAIAHGPAHERFAPALGPMGFQRVREPLGIDFERRAFVEPDAGVLLRVRLGAARQNEEVQNRLPQPARQLDDARIGEEFAQERTHGLRGGGGRGAEIDEQHARALWPVVRKGARGVTGHAGSFSVLRRWR